MTTRLSSFGLTDLGLNRLNNEDVWISLPEKGFFAIADGMGGHLAGEVAAKEAVESLCRSLSDFDQKGCIELILELRSAIERANRSVFEKGQSSNALLGMGTTLCCLLWTKDAVIYAHVGDSRIYRYRNQNLELLTKDHSLFTKWLSHGKMAEECETPYPYKNVITRAVGTGEKANPEIAVAFPKPDDLYLLCTDGLSDVLSLEEMEKILIQSTHDLENCAERLIQRAKFKGGSDNMTLLLVKNGENLSRQQRNDASGPEDFGRYVSRSPGASGEPL